MLTFILAESALETIPREIHNHPAVTRHARSEGKKPSDILLDRSYHHAAMLHLRNAAKRGRPDLLHFALLEATSSPLFVDNQLAVFVHTYGDFVIKIGEGVRLPRSYFRFEGLIEKLFREQALKSGNRLLLSLKKQRFDQLISELQPSVTVGLSRFGVRSDPEQVATRLSHENKPAIVVGGFPRGHFSDEVSKHLDALYAIHKYPLEAHVVIARILYEFEKVARFTS